MQFKGRSYVVVVSLPVAVPAEEGRKLAEHVLGETLNTQQGDVLRQALTAQKLVLATEEELPPAHEPTVRLELGPWVLRGRASSTNLELAQAMLLDRLVLALMETTHKETGFRDRLEASYVSWMTLA